MQMYSGAMQATSRREPVALLLMPAETEAQTGLILCSTAEVKIAYLL